MLDELKKVAFEANMALYRSGLTYFNGENVSVIDETRKYVVFKPAEIPLSDLKEQDMLVYDIEGALVSGHGRTLTDVITQLELYRRFDFIKSIAHTYSLYATSFAQAGRSIKPYGAAHALIFPVAIPCTRKMTRTEINQDYEKNVASSIISAIGDIGADRIHAVLVHSQSVFAWGSSPEAAVQNAIAVERLAQMAFNTELLQVTIGQNGGVPMSQDLIAKIRDLRK